MSQGQYLLFVDSDMTLPPSVVCECLAMVHATDAPGVVIPEVSIGIGFWARCKALERSCYAGDAVIEAARFFPKSNFEAVGGFDEALVGPEDWDLSLRVGRAFKMPRVAATIVHDEGNLSLVKTLAKKRYYASSFLRYWRKHRTMALWQANLIVRPAFLRNWRQLARHPWLTAGLFLMKTLESIAAVSGILLGPRSAPRRAKYG